MLVHADLCRTCSETTLLVFPRGGSCFDGLESPIHLSIIFAYSWSSQNPGNVVRKKNQYWQKLVEIRPENTCNVLFEMQKLRFLFISSAECAQFI